MCIVTTVLACVIDSNWNGKDVLHLRSAGAPVQIWFVWGIQFPVYHQAGRYSGYGPCNIKRR